ncbi:B-cell receptor CD22-like [Cheilinus undulatus]|uniref:B-cell receptor CD22-like n=1 Tax=Cheilinus undulatus TaxID=241271 RepID=UPI001BD49F79|nr:B-cell receptor CD22-like [Cheilinus undulatus]
MEIVCFLLSVFFIAGASTMCPQKAGLDVTTPQRMEALAGSCVQIPCSFSPKSGQELDRRGPIIGVWIKDDSRFAGKPYNVVFNSSRSENLYRIRISGDLRLKNCTTLFTDVVRSYTNTYFFRIESSNFTATASCNPLQITVRDGPLKPLLEIPADLNEKESVTITCSSVTTCPLYPPKLTWNLKKDSHNIMKENQDGTFTTKIQETITLTDKHDGYNISCSASYPVNEGNNVRTAEETKTLSVSYAPKDTSVSVSPPGLLSAGVIVTLSCSSRAKPRVSSFTWFKMSKEGPVKVREEEIYSFNVTEGGVYYCLAKNDLGDERSEIRLRVEGAQQPDSSPTWLAVVGGLIGIAGLIGVVAAIWWFKLKRSALQQTERMTPAEPTGQEPSRISEREDIHYGEIDFSKFGHEPSSATAQDRRQQQETVYAQVRVSKPVISSMQNDAGPEALYAQVKKN